MAELASLDWAIIVIYLASMVALGFYLAQRGGNFEEFFLAVL